MKFLHTADWQIGRIYSQFNAGDGVELTNARIESVRRIAQLATEHQVDAILVAGDVFDTQTPRDKTIGRLFEATAGYIGPWLLLPGNHDAALAESVWEQAKRLKVIPPNVILCLRPEAIQVTGQSGTRFVVLPAPLTQRHTHTDLTEWFAGAETTEGLIRIGLAHGSVTGILPEDVDSQNPIAADRAARGRLDYLALGDWHGLKKVDQRTWYSGTHEPERFRDNDPGHALLVQIDEPGSLPQVTPLKTAKYEWKQFALEVHSEADAEAAVRTLDTIDGSVVADVAISGVCDMATQERLQASLLAAERRAAALCLRAHNLRLVPTEADLQALRADGFVGDALQVLKTEMEAGGAEAELARDSLLHLARIQRDMANPAGSVRSAQGVRA